MIYYIADNHFGHKNVIRFDNRPFADTVLMDEVLVHNWNEREPKTIPYIFLEIASGRTKKTV